MVEMPSLIIEELHFANRPMGLSSRVNRKLASGEGRISHEDIQKSNAAGEREIGSTDIRCNRGFARVPKAVSNPTSQIS
jgi:hypothetical protein